MGFDLSGAGAGAASGLEQLIAQQRAEKMMQEQIAYRKMQQQQLAEDHAARLGQQKAQADALAESRAESAKTRQQVVNLNQLQAMPMGTTLGAASFNRLTNPETGAAAPESFDQSPGTPASLPSVSLSGMSAIGPRGPDSMAPQTQESSRAIDPSYRFKGTAQQQEKAAGLSSLDMSRKAAIDQATERAQQAWERIRLEGENQANRAALAAAAADLSRAKLETEREKNTNAAAKTPQPQFFQDNQGGWHAGIFDKGQFSEVPLPKGYTPTKTGPSSTWEAIKRTLGFGGGEGGPSNVISNDPNWGK